MEGFKNSKIDQSVVVFITPPARHRPYIGMVCSLCWHCFLGATAGGRYLGKIRYFLTPGSPTLKIHGPNIDRIMAYVDVNNDDDVHVNGDDDVHVNNNDDINAWAMLVNVGEASGRKPSNCANILPLAIAPTLAWCVHRVGIVL